MARKFNVKIAVVYNIYFYGKSFGEKVSETTTKTRIQKRKLRLEMEQLYINSEMPYLIVHFPDFYVPFAENS